MYLQRIELNGFKSFAQKTVLEFPTPGRGCQIAPNIKNSGNQLARGLCGVTSIVGPNGSGKSNIVDAARWVLGEQSLKLLRGKKSTDVIFSGSAVKGQLGMAEVSLYLNNEDGSAPIDYSEVAITRRIYRDGSSEYLLNKSPVRLFDILMILAQANFGQNTYSVIGQGMVDKIVNFSNQERKEFFDEATGVKQYQINRNKAVAKLKKSRENLEQAKSLLVELDPRLKSLTRQVNKLRQRQELERELKELQEKYYGRLWQDLAASYDEYALSYNTWNKQKIRIESKAEEQKARLEEISQSQSRTEEYDKIQAAYNDCLNRQNQAAKELAILRGKMDVEYAKAGQQNLSWLENRKDEASSKIKSLEAELKTLTARIADQAAKLTEKDRSVKILSDEISVWQNNLEIMQEEFYRLRSGGKASYNQEAIRGVLSLKDKISGICGLVSDLGRVKKAEHEAALAAAAGQRLSAIVVESDQDAVFCINWLKENRLPAVTFFPLNRLRDHEVYREAKELSLAPGAVGLAVDLLHFNHKYQKVFAQIFGSTVVVEDLNAAKAIGINRERMVTLDGDVLEKSGVIKGGYKRPEALSWKFFEDKFFPEAKIKDIAALKAKIAEQLRERENLFLALGDLRAKAQTDAAQKENLKRQLTAAEAELQKVSEELGEAQLSPEQRQEYAGGLLDKKEAGEQALKEIEAELAQIREQLDGFNLNEEKKKQEIFSLQQELYSLQKELDKVNSSANEVKIELAKIETRKEDVLGEIRANFADAWEFKTKKDYREVDLAAAKEKIEKLKRQLELIGGIDLEVEKEYQEVKERFDFLSEQSGDLEQAIKDLERVVEELDKKIKQQFEREFLKINKDFSRYFKQLFNGGSAKLSLVKKEEEQTEAEKAREEINEELAEADSSVENLPEAEPEKPAVYPEDKSFLANVGIEIEACPPGKKIKSISMLSGGEKTMTALALICSIISNNPSPFILFDEVDAALDEANSAKFSGIIEELAHKTQFIVITHNRAIMSRADVLYGVTMQGDGVSRLIGLKLSEAEKLGK